jgi:hypothetical protein
MVVTVIMCVLSTLAFCLFSRGFFSFAVSERGRVLVYRSSFSFTARKLARRYWLFAMALLAIVSFVSAVRSFVDLFLGLL